MTQDEGDGTLLFITKIHKCTECCQSMMRNSTVHLRVSESGILNNPMYVIFKKIFLLASVLTSFL